MDAGVMDNGVRVMDSKGVGKNQWLRDSRISEVKEVLLPSLVRNCASRNSTHAETLPLVHHQ